MYTWAYNIIDVTNEKFLLNFVRIWQEFIFLIENIDVNVRGDI